MAPTQRKSYTSAFKISVVKKAIKVGNRAAAREFQVDERCIRRWKSEQEILEKMPMNKKALRTGAIAWPALEDSLFKWITEQTEKGLLLSTVRIRLQAKIIAEQMGIKNFVGGPNWCFRFMKRKKLSAKNKIALGQKLPMDWLQKKVAFLKCTSKKIEDQNLNLGQIISMDEVPLTFDCLSSKTVNPTDDKIISISTTGNEKTSFTCVLGCAASGEKLDPMIIFKGKTVPEGNFPKGVVICANEKGWMSEEMMLFWLEKVYRNRKDAGVRPEGLIILDSMRSHLKDTVKSTAKTLGSDLAVIPAGLTKILQPLDPSINRFFKHEVRSQWQKWMQSVTNSGQMKVSFEEIALWVDKAWESVQADAIVSAFIKSEIIENVNEDGHNEKNELVNDKKNVCDKIDIDDYVFSLFDSETDDSDFEGFV